MEVRDQDGEAAPEEAGLGKADLHKAKDQRDFLSGTNCNFQSGKHICLPITLYYLINA